MTTTLETVGRRIYFANLPFSAKDVAKALGAHWDADRRQWWLGTGKRKDAEELVASVNGAASPALSASVGLRSDTPAGITADKLSEEGRDDEAVALREGIAASREAAAAEAAVEEVSRCRVYASVTYKGKRYYVIAEQRGTDGQPIRCRLTTLDGLTPFWADCSSCELVRTYEGRERFGGYFRGTVTEYPTIGSLRRFRESQKSPETRRVQCPECSSWCDAGMACRDCGGC